MCGFSGIFKVDGSPVDADLLRRMTATLVHRGPDDSGSYVSPPGQVSAGLGFRRLAIIDLEGGRQPMSSADGKTWIVFNGEIYNFLELRSELEARGRRFSTRSDTEVILHLYEIYGRDCVRRLRGMFAFAVWDSAAGEIFLARDRIGKKPLFYSQKGGTLYFASEMKAILECGDAGRGLRLDSVPLYFAYQFIPSPMTIFKEIHRLPPAHTLVCDGRGRIRIEQYWTLPRTPALTASVPDLCRELRGRLREATRIRMMSDVPLGAFLSGGVDSSAVVGMMAESSSKPVKTFSIGFKESDFSELEYARLAAERFGTDHHEFIVEPDAAEVLPRLAWHYDQPFADPSALPSYYVARETRRKVTVALNGDGGDESFGGYLRYQADRIFLSFARLPRGLRRGLALALRAAPIGPPRGRLARRIIRAASVLDSSPLEFNFKLFCYFDQKEEEDLFDGPLLREAGRRDVSHYFESLYGLSDSEETMDQVLACDAMGYLPDCLLVKMDIASMANSLEARSPFLDHELMEFAARIPHRHKVRWSGGKWILKEALKGFVPDPILRRRKMGFGIPLAEWFRGPLRGFLRENLLSVRARGRGYFRMERIEGLIEDHVRSRRDHGTKLWALLMFELWHQAYIDRASPVLGGRP